MTDAEIRQSYYDHWHLRFDNETRIRRNAPARIRNRRAWT